MSYRNRRSDDVLQGFNLDSFNTSRSLFSGTTSSEEEEEQVEEVETKLETKTGYDFDLVEKNQNVSSLECAICYSLLRNAHSTPCHHAFCYGCLVTWNRQQHNGWRVARCPSCNEQYDPKKIQYIGVVDRMVKTSIDIQCRKHDEGCRWTGKIIDYEDHQKKCDYEMVSCRHDGCNEKVARKDLDEHESKCVYHIMICMLCSQQGRKLDMKDHNRTCPKAKVDCPNGECKNNNLLRDQLQDHLTKECPFEKIVCEYSEVGCDKMIIRGDMKKHHVENIVSHQMMMFQDYQAMKKQLADVKLSNQKLEEELKAANNKINGLEPKPRGALARASRRNRRPNCEIISFPKSDA